MVGPYDGTDGGASDQRHNRYLCINPATSTSTSTATATGVPCSPPLPTTGTHRRGMSTSRTARTRLGAGRPGIPGRPAWYPGRSGGGQAGEAQGVECLHAGFVVTIERGDRTLAGTQAEVVSGRVGEPHSDLIEVDPDPLSVDQGGGERLLHDELELIARLAVLVRGDVADVLRGPER